MFYSNIPGYENYEDIAKNKQSQLRRLSADRSLVVFFDGKSATKGHKYDMLSKNSFPSYMVQSIKNILEDYPGEYELFGIIDEVTVIFKDSLEIANYLGEDCVDSVFSLLMSRFTKKFNKHIDCDFKGVAYFISPENITREIEYRKLLGYYTALEYYAKEYLDSSFYHNKTPDEIVNALKSHNLYDNFFCNKPFYEGIHVSYKGSNAPDIDFSKICLEEIDFLMNVPCYK